MSANGFITPIAGQRVVSDAQSPAFWYSPSDGQYITIAGTDVPFLSGPTDQNGPSFTLDARHTPGSIHDVFVFNNAGTAQPGTLPWAGSPPTIESFYGAPHNAAAVTLMTSGGGTQAVAQDGARYAGSILVDPQGKLTCHVSFGQARLWCVWNRDNQRRVKLQAGPTVENAYVTNMPTYPGWNTTTQQPNPGWAPLNLDVNNSLTVFRGRAEDDIPIIYKQVGREQDNTYGGAELYTAIGWGASNVPPKECTWGQFNLESLSGFAGAEGHTEFSIYDAPADFQGAKAAYMLVTQQGNGGGVWTGEHESKMTAEWWG